MQGKNNYLLKSVAFVGMLIITCSQILLADVSSSRENENKNKEKSKEIVIFDSCSKDSSKKCEPEKKAPVPDYSKSLK